MSGCFSATPLALPALPDGTETTLLISPSGLSVGDGAESFVLSVVDDAPLQLYAYGCPRETLQLGGPHLGPPPPTDASFVRDGGEWRARAEGDMVPRLGIEPCVNPILTREERQVVGGAQNPGGVQDGLWADASGDRVAILTSEEPGGIYLAERTSTSTALEWRSLWPYRPRAGSFDSVRGVMRVLAQDAAYDWWLLTLGPDAEMLEAQATPLRREAAVVRLAWGSEGEEAYFIDNFGWVYRYLEGAWTTLSATSTSSRDATAIAWQAPGRAWVTGTCEKRLVDNVFKNCGYEIQGIDGDRLGPVERLLSGPDAHFGTLAVGGGYVYAINHYGPIQRRRFEDATWTELSNVVPANWDDPGSSIAVDDGILVGWSNRGFTFTHHRSLAPRCELAAATRLEVRRILAQGDRLAVVSEFNGDGAGPHTMVVSWGMLRPHCGL